MDCILRKGDRYVSFGYKCLTINRMYRPIFCPLIIEFETLQNEIVLLTPYDFEMHDIRKWTT
jgi:hypothetical protein